MDFYENDIKKIRLTPLMAEHKIKNWCAYQERSHNETRYKLIEYGLSMDDADQIIVKLIADNFLNEERFALALTSGKLRIKHWGRNKIKIELKKHKVSDYCINKAMKSIDYDEYEKILQTVIEKKFTSLGASDSKKNFYTTLKYVASKGFESNLITEHLNLLLKK